MLTWLGSADVNRRPGVWGFIHARAILLMWKSVIVVGTMLTVSSAAQADPERGPGVVRFATFNASLNRETAGGLVQDLATPANAQARNVAEIIPARRAPISS